MPPASWLLGKRGQAEEDKPVEQEEPDRSPEHRLRALCVLSLFLHSTASVQEMMTLLLEQVSSVIDATFVYPLLLERKRQLLRASILEGANDVRLDAAMDAFQEDLTALEFSLLHNRELHRLLEDGEVTVRDSIGVLMDGVLPEEQWRGAEQALGIRKVALVPMVVENEPLGIVAFAFDRDDVDVEVLELLVGHLTLALRDLLVRDEAIRFSDIDPVTWVPNRRYFTQELEREITRGGRYGRGLALVALDIDGFGEFNADYGQSLGDLLLRTVATTLAESVSPPELVARLKDDDFVVLLPETNRATAVTVATRLLSSLSSVSVFGRGEEEAPPVTLSVAIACFPDDAETPQRLLARAMEDLEKAKQEHRAEARDKYLPAAAEGR